MPPDEFELNFLLAADDDAHSGDLRPSLAAGNVLIPPDRRPFGPVEAGRPALVGGAPAGLEKPSTQ
ncbi:MAG: hypothetical protein QOK40_2748, partial [Miltoncostaeaceae bacterium]|nr:hypothetical protein [Miltoncostaeaceae bacterium]